MGKLKIENYETIARHSERSEESIEIYDIVGRKLSHFTFHDSHQEIDISHLQTGIYFLKVDGNVYKVIKE
jgi:hypothetical protein